MKRSALQNKQVVVLRMGFRARKVFGTFEKQAPGLLWRSGVISLTKRKSRDPRGLETLFGHRLFEIFLLKLNIYTRKTLEQRVPSALPYYPGLTVITSTSGMQTSISSLRSLINLTQDGIHISCNVFTPCWVALKTFFLRSVMVRGNESFKHPMSINLNSEYLKVKE